MHYYGSMLIEVSLYLREAETQESCLLHNFVKAQRRPHTLHGGRQILNWSFEFKAQIPEIPHVRFD
jgi:hypothetical protein